MPSVDMKMCPFCAEEIRAEAIKCRFCGETLHQLGGQASALEIREFVIPFPEASAPRTTPIDLSSSTPFSRTYLQSVGVKRPDRYRDSYVHRGFTHIWNLYAEFMRERLGEIEEQGWELVSQFEPKTDSSGILTTNAIADRFEFQITSGSYGVITGCKFNLRRIRQIPTPLIAEFGPE